MKTLPLSKLFCVAALAPALLSAAQAAEEKSPPSVNTASTSVTATHEGGKGKITVTIDKDGKTETRVIELNTDDPAKAGAAIAEALKASDKKERPKDDKAPTYLGVMLDEVPTGGFPDLSIDKGTGLRVMGVSNDSPAARAGIEKGDILAKLDDQILVSSQQLIVLVRNKNPGDRVLLKYFREGKPQEVEITLATGNPDELAQGRDEERGRGRPHLDFLQKLDDPGARRLLGSKLWRVGPDGKILEEKTEEGEPLAWKRWFSGNEDVRKELEGARKKIAEELGRVQRDVAEELQGALGKIREETARLQEECKKLQHDLMEKVGAELKKAQDAAHRAQETAKQAAEEAKKREDEAAKKD